MKVDWKEFIIELIGYCICIAASLLLYFIADYLSKSSYYWINPLILIFLICMLVYLIAKNNRR